MFTSKFTSVSSVKITNVVFAKFVKNMYSGKEITYMLG